MVKLWLHRKYQLAWHRTGEDPGVLGTGERATLRAVLGEALKRNAIYISVGENGSVLIDGVDWAEAWEPVEE